MAERRVVPDNPLVRILQRKVTRRVLIGGGIVATLGLIAEHYNLLNWAGREVKKRIVANTIESYLNNVPNEQELTKGFPGIDRPITFSSENVSNVSWYVFGDSMGLEDGILQNSNPEDQRGSFIYDIQQNVNARTNWRWRGKNFSIPGAESGDKNPNDILGRNQLGNANIINELCTNPHEVRVCINLNGNDWKEIFPDQAALQVYEGYINKNGDLTQAEIQDLQAIIAKHNQISSAFGQNIIKILHVLEMVNQKRIAAGLSRIETTFLLPMSYRKVINLPSYDDQVLTIGTQIDPDPGNYTALQKAAYHITMAIYEQTASAIKSSSWSFSIHSISKFGLEKGTNINPKNGHLNGTGEANLADYMFNDMEYDQETFTNLGFAASAA